MHNLQIHEQGSTIQEHPSRIGVLQPYFKSNESISHTSLLRGVLTRFAVEVFLFPTSCLTQENKKITTDELLMRTNFNVSLTKRRALFQEIDCLNAIVLRGLHTMSLLKSLKSVPEGLKPRECKRTKLREPPPVPYIPTKDEVQEEVAKLRNLKIKTTIEKDTTLDFPVWHENGMRKAFLMHVTAVLDAIKKRGHFQDYKKAEKVHKEAKKAIESATAALSLLNGTGTKAKRFCKKKAREAIEKVLAKALDSVRSQGSQGSFQGE